MLTPDKQGVSLTFPPGEQSGQVGEPFVIFCGVHVTDLGVSCLVSESAGHYSVLVHLIFRLVSRTGHLLFIMTGQMISVRTSRLASSRTGHPVTCRSGRWYRVIYGGRAWERRVGRIAVGPERTPAMPSEW